MKVFLKFGFLLCLLFVPISLRSAEQPSVLTMEDLAEEERAIEEGNWYLGTPQNDGSYLESYSKWQCFHPSQAVLSLVEIEYDGEVKFIPQIEFETNERIFSFAPDGDTEDVDEPVLSAWKSIVENSSSEFCVYAAYLEDVDLDRNVMGEFWIIQKLKSSYGVWEVGDKELITKL